MSRTLLFAVGLAVVAAAVFLLIELRSGPSATPVSTQTAAPESHAKPAPPAPPPETRGPRPPIPTRPRERAIKPAVTSKVPEVPEVPVPGSRHEAAAVIREASDAYAHERFSEALKLAEEALAIDKNLVLARSLAVLSACGLNRADRAHEILAPLDKRRQRPLIARCRLEYDVELGDLGDPSAEDN